MLIQILLINLRRKLIILICCDMEKCNFEDDELLDTIFRPSKWNRETKEAFRDFMLFIPAMVIMCYLAICIFS